MDPVSLIASLITLITAVGASAKLIQGLCLRFKNALKYVEDLSNQTRIFESLLTELWTQLQDYRNNRPSQDTLPALWETFLSQMQHDIASLRTTLGKLEPLLKKNFMSSKLLLGARKILSEKFVTECRRRLHMHCNAVIAIRTAVVK